MDLNCLKFSWICRISRISRSHKESIYQLFKYYSMNKDRKSSAKLALGFISSSSSSSLFS